MADDRRSEPPEHFLRELNQPMGCGGKIWSTFVLVVIGLLVSPLYLIALEQAGEGWGHTVVRSGVSLLVGFFAVLLVYIWWRPRWMTALYRSIEARLVITAYLLIFLTLIGAAISIVWGLLVKR